MKKLDQKNIKEIAGRIYGDAAAAELLKLKRPTAVGFEEPLPDVIGFKQHDSECASDCIQETLLFSDGIREYTQPIMYGLTKEQVETRTSLTLSYEEWHPLQEYFYFVQKRFQTHYDVLNYMRTNGVDPQKYYDKHDEVCLLNPLFKQKEVASIERGVLALKHYKGEAKYQGTGLSEKRLAKIVDGMLMTMGVPYKRAEGVHKDSVGIILFSQSFRIGKAGQIEQRSLGHVVSFMKVQGNWLYYDNNMGFLPINEEIIEALAAGSLHIVIYQRVYFVKTDEHGNWSSAYDGSKWSKSHLKHLYARGQPIQGIYFYKGNNTKCLSIKYNATGLDDAGCPVKAGDSVTSTLARYRSCIYANLESNSKIFENMYHYIYDSIDIIKGIPDELTTVVKGVKTIIARPACSPMTHYWCSKINMALADKVPNSMMWFKIPKLARVAHRRERVRTPPEFLEKMGQEIESPGTPRLSPCLPGQIRDAKTLKCKDRKPNAALAKKVNSKGEPIKRTRKKQRSDDKRSPCPKGEIRDKKTGLCVAKLEPCPPGQVRDKETKLCRGRLEDKACPPGQIRDPKTKKCRDALVYKF